MEDRSRDPQRDLASRRCLDYGTRPDSITQGSVMQYVANVVSAEVDAASFASFGTDSIQSHFSENLPRASTRSNRSLTSVSIE
jgi:hypothetical protein